MINTPTIGRNLKLTQEFPDAIFLAEEEIRGSQTVSIIATLRLVRDDQSLDIDQTHLDGETNQSGDIVNVKALH